MKRWITLCALLLAGCQTTKPLEAADFRYSLPRTDAKANLTLTLQDCDTLAVKSDLSIAPSAGAQDEVVRIPASSLASARIKRSLSVALNDKGAIKSVSSSVSDRTPQIIGNYVTAAAKLAPIFVAAGTVAKPHCTTATRAAVDRAARIRTQIDSLRTRLNTSVPGGGQPDDPSDVDRRRMKDLAALTRELGALDPLLKIDTTAVLKLDPGQLGVAVPGVAVLVPAAGPAPAPPPSSSKPLAAELDLDPFAKWFDNAGKDNVAAYYGLAWWATPLAAPTVRELGMNKHVKTSGLRDCGLSMPVPDPRKIEVNVVGKGAQVSGTTAKKTVIASQFSRGRELCLDVGFGETRSIGLTFDEFGQTTEYAWTSEATGEGVSGVVAGSAESAATLAKTLRGKTDLEQQKAEVDELTTEQTLAGLRACKAIRDAGGTCTPPE